MLEAAIFKYQSRSRIMDTMSRVSYCPRLSIISSSWYPLNRCVLVTCFLKDKFIGLCTTYSPYNSIYKRYYAYMKVGLPNLLESFRSTRGHKFKTNTCWISYKCLAIWRFLDLNEWCGPNSEPINQIFSGSQVGGTELVPSFNVHWISRIL